MDLLGAVETESTFCSVRLLKGLCTLFMNSSHLMPPDFFSFPSVLNSDARKASQSIVNQIKSKQNPWESCVKKKKKCVHSSFSPSCSWWGAFLAPVTSLSVSLQAASQLLRDPLWLSASIWLSKLMFYIPFVTSCLRTLSGPQLWIQSKSFSVLKECGHKLWV